MKAEFFKAVCPLEIGDTVAIKTTKDGETKEALYLPQGCTVITTAGKGNDARKRMQVLRILRKLRKAGKIHEVYGLQRAAAGSRQTES